jgi:hypothetical protein
LFRQSRYEIKQKHTQKNNKTRTTTTTTTTTYALLSFCDEPELSTCLNRLAERREKSEFKAFVELNDHLHGCRRVDAREINWHYSPKVVREIRKITTARASMCVYCVCVNVCECVCVKSKTKHSEGIPILCYRWLYRLHISQAPFLCHYSLRFTVREANRPFSKTDKMFVKKISGTFHAFSQFARKCGGRPHTFSQLREIIPSVSPHFLAIALFLAICEKVCGRPTHFLANCEKVCNCKKAWADKGPPNNISDSPAYIRVLTRFTM